MKYIIQRVSQASVTIDQKETRSIGLGLLIYVGISSECITTRQEKVEKFVNKLQHLKIFEDQHGKINASLEEVKWEVLLISNFTLHGRNHKGNQIDFSKAAAFADAKTVYDQLVFRLNQQGIALKTGEFGAWMEVSSVVDGPVNIILEY